MNEKKHRGRREDWLAGVALAGLCWALAGCAEAPAPAESTPEGEGEAPAEVAAPEAAAMPAPNSERNAYFGDLHVHSRYSFDAFLFGTVATPDEAYRYARGENLKHALGFEMQMPEPLDFYSVTDHAMFLGMLPAMADPATEVSKTEFAKPFAAASTVDERRAGFQAMRPLLADPEKANEILDMNIVRSAWADLQAAANRANDPGAFTAFIGYEYTSGPESQNLHRNVIFRGDSAPDIPFSRLDSSNPEDLWAWMDAARANGQDAVAIPHNSNGSNGQMFKPAYYDDAPLDAAYAELRMRNEPLVEVTQVKGTSDTHPLLSPNDEWANFEIMPFRIATQIISNVSGSYAREALVRGLAFEESEGFNPFKFGLVGASDTHNASYAGDESDYYSKVGALDGTAELRGSVPTAEDAGSGPFDIRACPEGVPTAVSGESSEPAPAVWCGEDAELFADTYYTYWSAAGLTGAWAEENTRQSIHDAFRRKETFATSGPRIRVRFFGGYGLGDVSMDAMDRTAQAYAGGVPMGGDLSGQAEGAPTFLLWASRDARGAPLQRAQIIKGWVEDGALREQVFDVACSDGGMVDGQTHRCPDNGATVDLSDCSISEGVGAAELTASWQDPEFDPSQRALYYARVLENPTCRWSTWDALKAGVMRRSDIRPTLQERAWTSPIWYAPAAMPPAPASEEEAIGG